MILRVEDGSGVAGANTFAGIQQAAVFHAEHGGLIPMAEVAGTDIAFAAGGVITGPEGKFANIAAQSIIEVSGAASDGNLGFGHLRSVADDQLVVGWLDTVVEAAGAEVHITVYEQSGWWHASSRRMEQSLVAGTRFFCDRYTWPGDPVQDVQPLTWPRKGVVIGAGNPFMASGYVLPDNVIPEGFVPAVCWLSLADLEEPLLAMLDPRKALREKKVLVTGIEKVFGGPVRRRRFPHVDALVIGVAVPPAMTAGPFHFVEVV